MTTIKSVCDELLKDLVFDTKLINKLYKFQVGFTHKNKEHMEFFGGNLTGVQRVRFTNSDFSEYFDTIINHDPNELRNRLEKTIVINQNRNRKGELFKVSSDVFNIVSMYLIHRFINAEILTPEQKLKGSLYTALILNYKFLTSILSEWFKYPCDIKLAQATYAKLSGKFLIKKLGNWGEVINYRASEFVEINGLHYNTLKSFDDDDKIVKMINDAHGRIKDIMKNITSEHYTAKEGGESIYSSSNVMTDVEGIEVTRDKIHGLETYITYLSNVLHDKHSFIKNDLVGFVCSVSYTTNTNNLINSLNYMSEVSVNTNHKDIDKILRDTIYLGFNYLLEDEFSLSKNVDIPTFLIKLKGYFTASKSKDPELIALRESISDIVIKSNERINDQSLASTRTAVFLYISLRAYLKSHYSR